MEGRTRGARGFWRDPAVWFLSLVILVFGLRAVTTLAGGATWTMPGTGWRSVWQVGVVALAVWGLRSGGRRPALTVVIGAVYAVATVLEAAVSGTELVGTIPVDMRDRLVHPLVAALAAASIGAGWLWRRRSRGMRLPLP